MSNAFVVRPLAISAAAIAASGSTTVAGAPINVANDYAGVIWRGSTSGSTLALDFDMGADVDLDTIALFGIAGTLAPSTTWRIALATAAQGPTFSGSNVTTGTGTGNYWWPPLADLYAGSAMPASGGGKALWLKPAGGPPLFRYVRLGFTGLATNQIEIARAVIGKRIQLARNFAFGGTYGVRDLGSFDFSPRGVLLRRRSKKLRTVNLGFPHAFKDEIEEQVQPMLELIGNTEPIALVTDPDAHAQRQNRMYFGPLVGELANTQAKAGGGWEWRCPMVSLF